jgi:hypothetical protein
VTDTETITMLKSMGYRETKVGIWGKPIGYSLLIAKIDNGVWVLEGFFKGVDEKIYVWARQNFNCLGTLKSAEQECFHINYTPSNFEFMSSNEYFESIL